MIDFRQLIDVGLHFGHQKSRWCPRMEPYIWGHRGGVHLIDISKTAYALQKASTFLESIVSRGEIVLWVGTKKPAKEAIAQVGLATGMPYVDYRWVGGTITNNMQVKKAVTKLLYYDDIIAKSLADNSSYTKKEIVRLQKLASRLRRTFGGLIALNAQIGAVVMVDVRKEQTALLESFSAHIPVIALVDTNSDPSGIEYVIPGNDDSAKGIELVLNHLKDGVVSGLALRSEVMKKAKMVDDAAKVAKAPLLGADGLALEDDEEEDVKKSVASKQRPKFVVTAKKAPIRKHRS